MRYLRNLIRVVTLIFGLGIFGLAVAGAISDRKARENEPRLPTRIGQERVEPSFWEDVQRKGGEIWISIFTEILPGVLPEPVRYDQKDPGSLEALKSRTRNTGNGLAPDGGVLLNF